MIEEYETALEELKSSNEELVSVNEEMQSTNEELEASKEEIQSVNEELHTVNTELHNKLDALDRANSDLQHLFESTQVATVFLDKNLVIRSFTPSVTKVFNIRPTDRGRPITDFSSRLSLTELADDIAKVFGGQSPIERYANTSDHAAHYLVRLAAYWNDNKIEGVVVTFIDITGLTNAEARQRVLIAELQHRTRNLLTIVQSIAQQTLDKGPLLDSFSKRLGSLGRVQSLVAAAKDDEIDLGDIVRMELQAIGTAAVDGRVTICGPRVVVSFELIQTFGLALHELATNAVKYGALKGDTGRLKVSWDVRKKDGVPLLMLDWHESEVADMPETPRRGFGRELIERALVFTLRARSDLIFGAAGVSCHIEMPLPMHSDDHDL
jgi:two-component system CheB/CheR fusion protein